MKNNFKEISFTAILVAYFRAKYTEMPFTKEIYKKLMGCHYFLK